MIEMIIDAWSAQAITAAADLGIADALANGPLSADELAAAVDADAGALSRLLRALISRGIFRQRRDGRYDLTPLADPLRSDAEVSLAGFARWVGSRQHREHWSLLTEAVRTGRAAVPGLRGKPVFDYLADETELAEIFNEAMTGTSELAIAPVIAAYDFSSYSTIVDIGGGHGRLLSAILAATPHARGVLFDLPQWWREPRPYFANTMSMTERELLRGRSSTPHRKVATLTYSRPSFTTGPVTRRRASLATCAQRLARASTCCLSSL